MATTAPPVFATPDGPRSAVSAGLAGFPQDVIEYGRALRDGRYVEDPAWLLVATPTLVDPVARARGPPHGQVPLARSRTAFPRSARRRRPTASSSACSAVAPDFDDDVILGMLVKAPEDIEAANEHMIRGTFHGGNRTLPAERRAAAGAGLGVAPDADRRASTRPAARRTRAARSPARPGRNAAIVLLQDLGHDLEEVVRDAGRARAVGH